MVKISIKKDKKTKTKPRQKQKQKQSQKVIVNIGSNAVKARRAKLERNNKTPNIIVPQSMPLNSNDEILKYIRNAEQQKELIKKQEKNNELEKDKIKAKEKKPIVLPEEEAQSQFSTINGQNISSLTSGSSTPNIISRPIDSRSLFDTLMRVADLRGENPNSGRVSFSTLQSNPLSSSPTVDPFSNLSSSSSSIITAPTYESSDRTLSAPQSTASTVSSARSILPPFNSFTSALTDYLTDKQDQPPPLEPSVDEESVDTDIIEEEAPPQPEIQIEPPQEIFNTEPLPVEPEPEQQLIVYEPEKANAQSATATQQMMGMDNSTLPAFLRPINAPLPAMRLKDIIGLRPTTAETREIRQARINKLDKKLDKKPVLKIEDETVDIPAISEDDMKKYRKQTEDMRKAEETTDSQVVGSSVSGFDDFVAHINDAKKIKNGDLGKILIRNNINDPKTGNPFYVNINNKVLVRGSTSTLNRTQLTELLREKYTPGFLYK